MRASIVEGSRVCIACARRRRRYFLTFPSCYIKCLSHPPIMPQPPTLPAQNASICAPCARNPENTSRALVHFIEEREREVKDANTNCKLGYAHGLLKEGFLQDCVDVGIVCKGSFFFFFVWKCRGNARVL